MAPVSIFGLDSILVVDIIESEKSFSTALEIALSLSALNNIFCSTN